MGDNGDVVIAIDIGGTGIKHGLVSASSRLVASGRTPTHADLGEDAVIDTIVKIAERLAIEARAAGRRPVAVGLVSPGVIDETKGAITWAANIGFRDVPLRDLVAERLGLPAALDHDVRAAARAEAKLGAGQGLRRSWFVAIGTGIAAAYVVDGRTDAGAHGSSGEIGHVTVRLDGPECGCGRRGCLESITSASAVARRYAERTGETITAAQVVTRAMAGNDAAAAIWAETVDVLADGLLIGVTLYDPDMIVLGGGLSEARELLLEPVAAALAGKLTFQTMPAIRRAGLGDEAGMLGAAMLAWDAAS